MENTVKGYIDTQLSDITKIKNMLGYVPNYTLEKGLREMISKK